MSKLSDLLNSQPVSARQAAELAEQRGIRLPYGTIASYWAGKHGRPSGDTLEKLARVVAIPLPQLQEAAWGQAAPSGRYTAPPEADLLTVRQRRAVDELIRANAAAVTGAIERLRDDEATVLHLLRSMRSEDRQRVIREAQRLDDPNIPDDAEVSTHATPSDDFVEGRDYFVHTPSPKQIADLTPEKVAELLNRAQDPE
ncbi:hypothetical protein [Nocardia wallacei]|uniref:hypothetical protein n=1 Tax=Nocardia wallacei TaxID=480035 RepID=UPI0024551FCF|nr:hypothetical protein [Nocardia wallacei]